MSALEAARDRLLALSQRCAATQGGEPTWLARLRDEARAQFAEQGLPHTRLEEWRYTNVAPLAKPEYALAASPTRPVAREDLEHHAFPVFACSVLRSGASDGGLAPPNTSAARASSCCFHSVIWVGCTLNCSANSAVVLSPFMAANATWALKVAP